MDTSSLRWEEKLNAGGVLVDCQKYHAEIRGTAKYRLVVIGHQVGRSTWRYLDAPTRSIGAIAFGGRPSSYIVHEENPFKSLINIAEDSNVLLTRFFTKHRKQLR
jgi:hypothetical protein